MKFLNITYFNDRKDLFIQKILRRLNQLKIFKLKLESFSIKNILI